MVLQQAAQAQNALLPGAVQLPEGWLPPVAVVGGVRGVQEGPVVSCAVL